MSDERNIRPEGRKPDPPKAPPPPPALYTEIDRLRRQVKALEGDHDVAVDLLLKWLALYRGSRGYPLHLQRALIDATNAYTREKGA